ncbi:TrkH family potassium uptake protein [Heyndrickxia ginsengihumi]|uniref:TrkH family potassium uptake protein n=1 Tax=Heyndrickxia ginsengihumi TaxID=363870 RepID=UPI00047124A9|nr:TrkH family potassium uptake protein [Heyndrickxia ginsengihumi]MBE6183998.1 Trk family potassium uptake protein [Bacillus sp. (in: firmicutes)]MCM3022207.1 TrkH family potassium uptake protein [Heyndrickxia ginsengihumi]
MKRKRSLLNPSKILVIGFAITILIGTLLLTLPISTKDGNGLPLINALFTATSATCVTGLVVVDTGTTFTYFGQVVILCLIQIGGLGFMSFATLLSFLLGKKISLRERLILQESFNSLTLEGIVRLVKRILVFTFVIEFVGGVILSIRFAMDMPIGRAIWFGFFHAISNFNNAGFDIIGHFKSLTDYVNDPTITLVVSALIILGGLGFFVMDDLFEYRKRKKLFLHTKIVLFTSAFLIIFGTMMIFLLEMHNGRTLERLSPMGKILASFYQSVAPRTAGSNTLNITDLRPSTLFFIILLMFIGASSGSTGGGIKTTTLAVLLGAVWSQYRGKSEIVLFKQSLKHDVIYRALTVTVSGLGIVMVVTFLLSISEGGDRFLEFLFEATSAFATVGLSMDLTPHLSVFGKILIMLTMFIGRVGPLTLAFALALKHSPDPIRYPEGKIMIG